MKIKNLTDLYIDQLQDMHSSEKQIIKALPKMANAASEPKLKKAFEHHLEETREQLERLEGILKDLGKNSGRKVCEATKGLVKEGDEMIDDGADEQACDAGLICCAQKIEHYEIATYGCLRAFANLLGRSSDAKTIEKTLDEEKNADVTLTELAMGLVNEEAMA